MSSSFAMSILHYKWELDTLCRSKASEPSNQSGLQMRVRDEERYSTGSVSDLSIEQKAC